MLALSGETTLGDTITGGTYYSQIADSGPIT